MSKAWPRVPLAEALRYRKEFVTIDDLTSYKRPRVQLHAQGVVLRDEVLGALIKTKKQQACRSGDFLVAEIDAKVGGFGIVPDGLEDAIVSSHYFLFNVIEQNLDRRFLDYFIRTAAFREQVEAQGSTNYAAIRPADVLTYEIPLPPIEEQRRIVARIEGLATEIEHARTLRRQATQEAEALTRNAIGHIIGGHWPAVPLEEACNPDRPITYGIVQAGEHIDEGVPYIRVSDMAKRHLSPAGMLRTSPEIAARYKRSEVKEGDVVFAIRATIGKMRLVPPELDGANLTQGTARIAPSDIALAHFLYWALQSRSVSELVEIAAKGSTFREITLGRLRQIPVPLPPLSEQRRIVAELDELQAEVDRLKALQAETAAEIDALLPAILYRAFRGELMG
jgi:type I restriction enzyme S subunit